MIISKWQSPQLHPRYLRNIQFYPLLRDLKYINRITFHEKAQWMTILKSRIWSGCLSTGIYRQIWPTPLPLISRQVWNSTVCFQTNLTAAVAMCLNSFQLSSLSVCCENIHFIQVSHKVNLWCNVQYLQAIHYIIYNYFTENSTQLHTISTFFFSSHR